MAGKLGILVGGGPAPGINGVISAATIEACNNGVEVIGFYEGFRYLMEGTTDCTRVLNIDQVSRIHLQGGSILRTSRANPTAKKEYLETVVRALKQLEIRYLLTIGGDDTAYSASQLAVSAQGAIAVAHIPKTIDNDLPLPPTIPTFGFHTAMHNGVAIVKNLMADAQTAPRWYLVVAMGRKAGHLALGIGKAAGCPLTIIPEEFGSQPTRFKTVCDILEGSILKRRLLGRDHGVAILAEGLVENMTEAERDQVFGREDIERDDHGHIKLDDIEFGRAVRDELRHRFKHREDKVTLVSKNLGYELRCADPTPYDCEYTRNLGYGGVRFLLEGGSGSVISFQGGVMVPLPFQSLRDPETGRPKVRMVDVTSESYHVAREYMIRVDKRDREDPPRLQALAHEAKVSQEQFLEQFGYLMV